MRNKRTTRKSRQRGRSAQRSRTSRDAQKSPRAAAKRRRKTPAQPGKKLPTKRKKHSASTRRAKKKKPPLGIILFGSLRRWGGKEFTFTRAQRASCLHFFTVAGLSILGAILFFQLFFAVLNWQSDFRAFLHSWRAYNHEYVSGLRSIDFESVATRSHLTSPMVHRAVATDSFYSPPNGRLPHYLEVHPHNGCGCNGCATCCGAPSPYCHPPPQKCCDSKPPTNFLITTLSHDFGKAPGIDEGYTSLDELLVLNCFGNNLYPLVDFKISALDGGEYALNAGLGVRYFAPCSQTIYGVNAFYDFRKIDPCFHFTQAGLGFEVLNPCWDFRINGYFPLQDRKLVKECRWDYPEGYFIERRTFKEGRKGADFELGARLGSIRLSCFSSDCTEGCIDFYGAAGSYYFRGECNSNIVGGKLRLRAELCNFIFVEGKVTRDSENKTLGQVEIGISFPLGCCRKQNKCARYLSQPIERREIIYINEYCRWKWNY